MTFGLAENIKGRTVQTICCSHECLPDILFSEQKQFVINSVEINGILTSKQFVSLGRSQ
jgi:hypothetical protein